VLTPETPRQSAYLREELEGLTPPASGRKPRSACNCQKSKCIKLYCECYANGVHCGPDCNCVDCRNNNSHEVGAAYQDSRTEAIRTTLGKNPAAFQPKIVGAQAEPEELPRHHKVVCADQGCSCRRSRCLKKYCECFQAGIPCSALCKCQDCANRLEASVGALPPEDRPTGRSALPSPYFAALATKPPGKPQPLRSLPSRSQDPLPPRRNRRLGRSRPPEAPPAAEDAAARVASADPGLPSRRSPQPSASHSPPCSSRKTP